MARRIIPLLDRVLVEKIIPEAKTLGGVLLPDTVAAKLNQGKVIAVGAGGRSRDGTPIPPSVKEGDTVLLPEYGGNKVQLDDKEYVVYREDDLIGIMQE